MKGKKSEGIHLAQAQCGLYNFIIIFFIKKKDLI